MPDIHLDVVGWPSNVSMADFVNESELTGQENGSAADINGDGCTWSKLGPRYTYIYSYASFTDKIDRKMNYLYLHYFRREHQYLAPFQFLDIFPFF